MLDVLPGNAAEVMLGESATPESLAALTAKLGLDRPPLVRYVDWMKGLAGGDLGTSTAYDTPIGPLIGERLRVTVSGPLQDLALLAQHPVLALELAQAGALVAGQDICVLTAVGLILAQPVTQRLLGAAEIGKPAASGSGRPSA